MSVLHKSGIDPKQLHIHTPLLQSPFLTTRIAHTTLLKMDSLQPSGSFKIRGHGHLVATNVAAGIKHFVSSSGGNAGMAVAVAARALDAKVTIVVPQSTPDFMKQRLRAENATVEVYGRVWDDADAHAQSLAAADHSAVHVSPFDDELLWYGHASLIDELVLDLEGKRPGAIVVSCGGGGLFLGVALGLNRHAWTDVPVIVAETDGADSFAKMLQNNGQVTRLHSITSIAKSLGALAVSQKCADIVRERSLEVHSVVVSDRQAVEACSLLAVAHRVLVEPACGAAVAAAEQLPETVLKRLNGEPVVVIVCGGNMTSPSLLAAWVKATGASEMPL